MPEPKVAILVVATALLASAPTGLAAQVASSVEAGALVTGRDGEIPSSILRLAPGVRFDRPHVSLTAHGSAWLSEQQWQAADGSVSGTFTAPTIYGVRAELIGNASRAFSDQSLGADQVDVQTRVNVQFNGHGGVWVGGGVARPWRISEFSLIDVGSGGAWTQLGDVTMTSTVTSVAMRATTASEGTHQPRYNDLEGSLRWEHGAFELDGQTGYRFGSSEDVAADSRRWSSGNLTVWFTERMALVAGGGRQPANLARGFPARSFGMVGMKLAYWPIPKGVVPVAPPTALLVRSFEVRPGASGTQKIIIRVGGVESVDIMGDFSDWSPLTLVRHGRDLWELSVPLSAGVHRINVRVDGGQWVAPPGLPTMPDGYNGDVGMMVIPAPDK
jgi:hypothetical protein